MRIWTLHPRYLDRQGILALWREGLLAQKVLQGGTRGYRSHPQLARFAAMPEPTVAIAAYLRGVLDEGTARGYVFDSSKIGHPDNGSHRMAATDGQIAYEWDHLLQKLAARSPELLAIHRPIAIPQAHPIFDVVSGPPADWERPRP